MSMLKSNIAFLLVVLGAVFTAPFSFSVSADNSTFDLDTLIPYLATSAHSLNADIDYNNFTYVCNTNSSNGDTVQIVYIYGNGSFNGEQYSISSVGVNSGDYVSCNVTISSNNTPYPFVRFIVSNGSISNTYQSSGGQVLNWTYWNNLNSEPTNLVFTNISDRTVDNLSTGFINYYPIGASSSNVDNVDYDKFDPMLVSYLSDQGFSVSEAHLRNSSGSSTLELPIVTDFSDLPPEYEGLYIIRYPDDFLFHFKIALTTGSNPNDYSDYWNDFLTFTFTCGSSTEFNIIYGVIHPLPTSEGFANSPNGSNLFKPYLVNHIALNAHSYSTYMTDGSTVTSSGDELIFGQLWRYQVVNPVSRIEIPDFYLAINFSNVVDGTDTTGKDSTNYDNSITNYYHNQYNMSLQGMTGTISGATSFSADYSRQMPDTTIDYNDNVTFDDAGLSSFFTRFWALGNGYFTSILLSVLAVAFAAYIIYGRNG